MGETLTEFEKNCRLVVGMNRFAARERAWVQAKSSHNSEEAFGHGGSVAAPHWSEEDTTHAMARYLGGERSPHFDMTQRNLYYDLMEDLGLHVYRYDANKDHLFPFTAHATDPDSSGYFNERFFTKWTPTGDFYALYDRKFQLHICQQARPDEDPQNLLREALGAMRQAWKNELSDRAAYLAETNRMRSERGLPLYPSWKVANDPMRYSGAMAG